MPDSTRIYLDNAATSWPKPPSVYDAVDHYQRHLGAPAGRGSYEEAACVERAVDACRRGLAQLIGVSDPRHLVFTFNATDALNLALHGLLKAGDHVVTTVVEHNSVLRPLRQLEDQGVIQVTRVDCDAQGVVDAQRVADAIRPQTRLVALIHASNVTGALQPAGEVAQAARAGGCLSLLDAAQTVGHLPVDVAELGFDLVAAAGHKGLLGPLGSGFLYLAPGLEAQLRTIRQGGTGTDSDEDRQPESLPEKYEPGNLNVPAIVGLAAGVAYLRERGIEDLRRHERELTRQLLEGFREIPGLRIHGPADSDRQVGVVSVTLDGWDPRELAGLLDSAWSIQVRAGLQCAPRMHAALRTLHGGGTVRFSVGAFTESAEIDRTLQAVREIASMKLDF